MNKKTFFYLAPLVFLFSCSNGDEQHVENTTDTVTNRIESKIEEVKDNFDEYRDENFVSDVYEKNKQELYLIDLAVQKGSSTKLKQVVAKMKGDHEKLDKALTEYAIKHNIKHEADVNGGDLDNMDKGIDWDSEWKSKVKDAHEELLNRFTKKQENANDKELQDLVAGTIPVIQHHLEMLNTL